MLTETKIYNKAYCHNRLSYDVVCFPAATTDARGAQGGVGMVV